MEGEKRSVFSSLGMKEIRKHIDILLIICNSKCEEPPIYPQKNRKKLKEKGSITFKRERERHSLSYPHRLSDSKAQNIEDQNGLHFSQKFGYKMVHLVSSHQRLIKRSL